jgi:hypothetical protein
MSLNNSNGSLDKAYRYFTSRYTLITMYVAIDREQCPVNIHCIGIVNFPFKRNNNFKIDFVEETLVILSINKLFVWKLQRSPNLKSLPPLPPHHHHILLLRFYFWQYYPTSILVFCTRLFQAFLYLTSWLQFFSFSFFKSFITSSLHLFFGRPLDLIPLQFNQWKSKLINYVLSQELRSHKQKTRTGKAHYDAGIHMLVTGRVGIPALYTIYFDSFAGVYRYHFSDCLVEGSTYNRWGSVCCDQCHFSMIETPGQGTGCMVQYKTQ